MCGIVGYLGNNPDSLSLGLEALKRLNYRGYDSAGLAYWDGEKVCCEKAIGQISNLERKLNGHSQANPIILHTRWATHGAVTEANAHPHHDCQNNIFLVHNGVIENYQALRSQLEKEGHVFTSETDTEVIAHLIEKFFAGKLEDAVRKALPYLSGTYGLAVIARDDPHKMVAARLSCPLLIGLDNSDYIVASDPAAVIPHTKKAIYLDDDEMAVMTPDNYVITREKKPEELEWSPESYGKNGFPHFMLKEMHDQPESIANVLKGRLVVNEGRSTLGGLERISAQLAKVNKIYIVGCGTAKHAGMYGELLFEELAGIPTRTLEASEFRYRDVPLDRFTTVLAISQSGETADTLAAIKKANDSGAITLGITNVVGSSQSRLTKAGIYTRSGPEIGVASTKAFTSQLITLVLLALFFARQKRMTVEEGKLITSELLRLPELTSKVLRMDDRISDLADHYCQYSNFLFVGRKFSHPVAVEGALKLKEISYCHAEGMSAGELKHGCLALIDENFPSIAICPSDSVYEKTVSNIQEVKARKGRVIAIASEGNKNIAELVDEVIYMPSTLEILNPILAVIPLQLFAYHVAVIRGCEIDKPRNLAKSVTVE